MFDWDNFLGELTQAKTRDQAKQTFDVLLNKQGLTFCLYADVQEPEKIAKSISFLDNFPEEYLKRYIEQDYANHDIATNHCLTSAQPLLWSKVDAQLKNHLRVEQLVREDSRDAGLKAGVTFPLHHASNTAPATLSLATDGDVREFDKFIKANIDSLYLAGIYFHSFLQTLPNNYLIEEIPSLSKRQSEVLKWTLNNKRTKEIADLMNLSERTVNLHIGLAMKKLAAKSRFEAAAKASKYGIL